MFLQPASFMIYDFMTYHGIKACTRMRPVLRTARWKSKRNKRCPPTMRAARAFMSLRSGRAKLAPVQPHQDQPSSHGSYLGQRGAVTEGATANVSEAGRQLD